MLATGFSIVDTGFIWQTFGEEYQGASPKVIAAAKPAFRAIANALEILPWFRRFGVSQVVVCRK